MFKTVLCSMNINRSIHCMPSVLHGAFSRRPVRVIEKPRKDKAIPVEDYIQQNARQPENYLENKPEYFQSVENKFNEDFIPEESITPPSIEEPFNTKDVADDVYLTEKEEMLAYKKIHSKPRTSGTASKYQDGAAILHRIMYKPVDDQIFSLITNTKSRKLRVKHGKFLIEGNYLIKDALDNGLLPDAILFSSPEPLRAIIPQAMLNFDDYITALNRLPLYKAPYKKLSAWSSLTTCPGIMGVFNFPSLDKKRKSLLPLTIMLDNISDPSNMGAILRTAACVGAKKVVLMKGCCDAFEDKVLRAGCGAHYCLDIEPRLNWQHAENVVSEDSSVYIADMMPKYQDGDMQNISLSIEKLDDLHHTSKSSRSTECFNDKEILVNDSYNDPEHVKEYFNSNFPVENYFDVEYFNQLNPESNDIVIITGGETGLTDYAKKLASDHKAIQICIPLENKMNSLNTSISTSIVMYEIQKQFLKAIAQKRRNNLNKVNN